MSRFKVLEDDMEPTQPKFKEINDPIYDEVMEGITFFKEPKEIMAHERATYLLGNATALDKVHPDAYSFTNKHYHSSSRHMVAFEGHSECLIIEAVTDTKSMCWWITEKDITLSIEDHPEGVLGTVTRTKYKWSVNGDIIIDDRLYR